MNAKRKFDPSAPIIINGPSVKVGGFFKVEKYKTSANGEVIEDSKVIAADWFPNLILNQGLDLIGSLNSSNFNTFCQVGSGSTTPANTQTTLVSRIAGSNTYQASSYGTNNTISPYYGWNKLTYRFIAGVATGNISELGIAGATSTLLFSRALVLDGLGAPTTITVLSDEVLDVSYEFRLYPDLTDHSSSFVLATDGGTYDYTIRATGISASVNTNYDNQSAFRSGLYTNVSGFPNVNVAAETNVLLSLLSAYSTGGTSVSTAGTLATYTNGNYYRDCTVVIDLNFGNFTTGIGRIVFNSSLGNYQMVFPTTKIPKTLTKKLTLVVRWSWARA